MVRLASWCALRYGEIAEVRLKDIKLRHVSGRSIGVIPVRRGVVGVNRKIQVESPQVGGRHPGRSDPASPDPGHQGDLEAFAALGRECLLFPAANGHEQWPSTITHLLQDGRDDRGRSDLRFHDLRHAGAVVAAQQVALGPTSRHG